MTGKDAETGDYFAFKFKPDLPESQMSSGSPYAVFAVDVSLSSNPDRFNIWLALIQAILKNNQNDLKQFAVLFFNVETFWWKEGFSANTPENLEALSAYIQTLALEGATDMGSALKEASQPSWADNANIQNKWDIFLLSDGSATWGESDTNAISDVLKSGNAASLFAYQTGLSGTDTRLLSNLARISGGSVFSITGNSEVQTASTAHRNRPWELVNISIPGAKDLLIAGRPESLFPGQELMIVGKGIPEKGEQLTLTVARHGKETRIPVILPDPVSSDLTPRIYGQVEVGQMEEFRETVQAEPEAYSRHFRITGQTCSLLMLESEADYQRFNIKPQDDALVVKITNASEVIAKQLKKIEENANHAKARFMSVLEKLKKVPMMNFSLSEAFQIMLEKMPEESFSVQPVALKCKARTWNEISGVIREQLTTGKPDYDSLSQEAENRKSKYGNDDSLKALSSLIELNPGDPALCRDIAFTAMEMGFGSHAYHLLRRVAEIRPHEFLLYREMAFCLTNIGKADLAMAYSVDRKLFSFRFYVFQLFVEYEKITYNSERIKNE